MAKTWTRHRVLLVVLAVVVALAIVGCTAEGDDAEVAADPTATPVADAETPGTDDQEALADDEATPETEEPTPTVPPDEAGDSPYPVTVTRTDGVELTIEERPERIVSLSPGATEIFFEIGAGDQLAAVDMFSDYPPEALDLPQIDAYQPDPEAIVDLDPDLVFVVYDAGGIVELLEGLDVTVLFLDAPATLSELLDQIRVLGDVTGDRDQADELADSLDARIADITDRLDDVENAPRVYHELDDMLFTIGPDSFIGDLYNLLGAENIAAGAEGDYPQLSEEVILEQDPDVIIVPTHGELDGTSAEAVRERPGWDEISAVENDRVYEIDGDIISRPGPRIVDALEQLAGMLYPEEFQSSHELTITTGGLRDAA